MATTYKFNPKTGGWKENASGDSQESSNSSATGNGNKPDNLKATNTDKKAGKGKAEKKANYIEIKTLEGTLSCIPTKQTIKIKPGDTIALKNLGKFYSGKYYVKEVSRQISSSGYVQSMTVIRTNI